MRRVLHALLGVDGRGVAGGGLATRDVGVVTPYRAQLRLMHSLLQPLMQPSAGGAAEASPSTAGGLELATVDSFQGREKDVVILSLVRSNASGELGFLLDERRMNVALTRARRGLIVLGDPATLGRSSCSAWGRFADWAAAHGVSMALSQVADV